MRYRIGAVAAVAVMVLLISVESSAQWTWTPQTGRWINMKKLPKETAELQVEYARGLMLDGQYKKAVRETEKFDDYYSDSEYADDNQFLRAEILLKQGKNMDAAKQLQQVVSKYPDSDLYSQVIKMQYEIGDQYFERGQKKSQSKSWWTFLKKRPYKRAIEVYNMVVDNQPFTPAAAEAQYKVGLCQQALKHYVEAAYEYKRVIEDYSGSDWMDEASYGLASCYYEASLRPEYDQTPSRLAVEAMDDFTTRYPSDARAGELAPKRAEMRERMAQQRLLTAKFYERRRRFDAARIYYQVVVEQFSDTKAAASAQEWLAANAAQPAQS